MPISASILRRPIEGSKAHIAGGLEDLRVDPMAGPAGFGEDRAHVSVEIDLLLLKGVSA